VSITAWRITKRKHAKAAFTGGGARKYGGRWNSPGTSIVYTSETQSLAVLEMVVHLEQLDLLQRYVLIAVTIDETLIEKLDRSRLPLNWRIQPPPSQVRNIGDEWASSNTSVALRVPSALVPAENNLLLNPTHADFHKLVIGDPVSFAFDQRLAL
jgi:RES domain-containing protein